MHILEHKREYLQKGDSVVWQQCVNCNFKTPKQHQWTVGTIEEIWKAIDEIRSQLDLIKNAKN